MSPAEEATLRLEALAALSNSAEAFRDQDARLDLERSVAAGVAQIVNPPFFYESGTLDPKKVRV